MNAVAPGSSKPQRWEFLYGLIEGWVILICLMGFAAGIALYWKDLNDSAKSPAYAREGDNGSPLLNGANSGAEPIFPPDNYTTTSADTPDLFYTWKNSLSYPVVFQIASRSDFAGGIMVEEKLTGLAIQGRFLPPGIYYWRLSSEIPMSISGGEGLSPGRINSPPMRLVVLSGFDAPEIITPRDGGNIRITGGIPVDFRWEKLNYADSYDFKLFSTADNVPLYEVSYLRDTVVQVYFNPQTVGRYRWTVQANMDSSFEAGRRRGLIKDRYFSIGASGAARVPGFVRGVIKAGAVHTPITLLAPGEGVSFINTPLSPQEVRWSTDENFINSRVIFSRDLDPAADPQAIVQYIEEGETSIPLPNLSEGVWYWIVQSDSPGGQGFSAAAPSWFTILPRAPLDPPQYLQPADEGEITLEQLTADHSITFAWEEVPEANAYIFSLFDTDHMKLLFSSPPSPDTSFVLTDLALLTADDYTWQVEAVYVSRNGAIERRGMIQHSSFMVSVPHSDTLRVRSQGTVYGY